MGEARITRAPSKPLLMSPPDKAQLSRFPSPPELEWSAADSGNLSFLVEWQFGQPGQADSWSPSVLTFVEIANKDGPLRATAPFGIGRQPHRWRIWALNLAGAISISDWRTIDFTN
jgi:hypothetical protein